MFNPRRFTLKFNTLTALGSTVKTGFQLLKPGFNTLIVWPKWPKWSQKIHESGAFDLYFSILFVTVLPFNIIHIKVQFLGGTNKSN